MAIATFIIDPDDLNSLADWTHTGGGVFDSTEISVDAINKTITLNSAGALSTAGVGPTGQALYSFFKDRWKDTPLITQYDFPMVSITNEQFEFSAGWKPADDTTRKLLRTCGWAEVDSAGVTTRQYAGIVTLGTLGATDQPYYTNSAALDATSVDTILQGPVNEAVKVLATTGTAAVADITFTVTTDVITSSTTDLSVFNVDDIIVVSGGGANDGTYTVTAVTSASSITCLGAGFTTENFATTTIVADTRTSFKIFVREQEKLYADSTIADIGVSSMTTIVYRFPVTNAIDLKIFDNGSNNYEDLDISATTSTATATVSPYDKMTVTYLAGTGFAAVTDTTYALDAVVQEDNGIASRWFICTTSGTVTGSTGVAQSSWGGTAVFSSFSGERQVTADTAWTAYNVIVDADSDVSGVTAGDATKLQVYAYTQWAIRALDAGVEIDTGRVANIADTLCEFVGDQLVTKSGVFIDSHASVDTNGITFTDVASGTHLYPIVVTVTFNFNSNLAESGKEGQFYAYYTTGVGAQVGNDFGTATAIQLKNSVGGDVGAALGTPNKVPTEGQAGAGSSHVFSYSYDADTTNGRTGGTVVPITVVAIGLDQAAYVQAAGTIGANGTSVSLVAPLERNYSNPV